MAGFGLFDDPQKRMQDTPLRPAQVSGGVTQVQQQPGLVDKAKDLAVNKGLGMAEKKLVDPFLSGLTQSAAPAVASGVEGGAILGSAGAGGAGAAGAAGLGAAATAAAPWLVGGYLGGKALGLFNEGGPIEIKPENKGKFTAKADSAGMGVQEYASKVMANKEDYPSSTVKQANFAKNAASWHNMGGMVDLPQGYNAGDWVGKKVSHLVKKEGMKPDQAFAVAMNMAKKYNNGGEVTPDMMMPEATPDPMMDSNLGYVPSGPLGVKDQMEMDKMMIQRGKAFADEDRKERAFNEGERRKEESHKEAMKMKKEVHNDRKGPLAE